MIHKIEENLALSGQLRVDEACLRFERACKGGQRPRIEEYLDTIPVRERAPLLRELLALELAYRRRVSETVVVDEYRQRFPEQLEVVEAAFEKAAMAVQPGAEAYPARLGRYRVAAKIGAGSFGVVYKAYDEELQRDVAIKVPRRDRVNQPADVE